ncbi:MAG TPA: ATP-binding cassette domain-containing protein [Nitriliruptoraceae bacterium]|nr:ATP-binding cassette domain-containing protein [Nitriliruptoraceae bacterium]
MLTLTDLRKRYGDVTALDGLSLAAPRGRILGFLGPNGAGKTTSMRSVFGLVDLDDGDVAWEGSRVTAQGRLRFGYMPEQRGLYRRMPAGSQLTFMGRLHGMTATAATAAASEWLERLGLGDRADDVVSDLSHGNQQRVQLAAALVHEPDLLVLDEPFSGLDPLGVEAMSDVLVQRAAAGSAVVFSSHQLDLVEDLVDDVVIIAEGRDRLSGSLDEVRSSTGVSSVTFRLAAAEAPSHLTLAGPQGPTAHAVRTTRDGLARLGVPAATDPAEVVAALAERGTVERFSFEPASLSEVFREVVGISLAEAEARAAEEAEQSGPQSVTP